LKRSLKTIENVEGLVPYEVGWISFDAENFPFRYVNDSATLTEPNAVLRSRNKARNVLECGSTGCGYRDETAKKSE
jgi:hypothetical protein